MSYVLDILVITLILVFAMIPVVIASIILTALRNALVAFMAWIGRIFVFPLALLLVALDQAIDMLRASEERTREGLAYRVRTKEDEIALPFGSSFSGWDLIGPFVFLIFFAALAWAEFPIAALRLGALFGFETSGFTVDNDLAAVLSGVLFTATLAVWGFIAFDLFGWSPLQRPYADRPWVKAVCLCCFGMTLVTGMLLVLWGQLQVEGVAAEGLGYVLIATLGFLIAGATALSAWAVFPIVAVIVVCVIVVVRWVLSIWMTAIGYFCRLIDAIYGWWVALVDVFAALGYIVWDWLVDVLPKTWMIRAAPERISRPDLFDRSEMSIIPNDRLDPDKSIMERSPEDEAA